MRQVCDIKDFASVYDATPENMTFISWSNVAAHAPAITSSFCSRRREEEGYALSSKDIP